MTSPSLIEQLKAMFRIETPIPRDVVVGIDFGACSLKVVQLSSKYGIPTLDTYGEVGLGPYVDAVDGAIVPFNRDVYIRALRDVVRDAGITAHGAALALPYSATFTVILTIDSLDHNEITARVPVLIKNLIPVRLQDVAIDWFPFATDDVSHKTSLIAVAAYTNTLTQLREVAAKAGFEVVATELEYFSAIRVASLNPAPAQIILDIGATTGKAYFVVGGKLVGVHGIATLGGELLTKQIARAHAGTFFEAEEGKRTAQADDPNVQVLLANGVRDLQSLIGAHVRAPELNTAPCIVIGGGARLTDIEKVLHEMLGRDVVRGEPFHHVAYPEFLGEILKRIGGAYAPSLASALAVVSTVK